MKLVNPVDHAWFFSRKGNLQGLRTGADACAEHEVGIDRIHKAFGLELGRTGLDRYKVQVVPDRLVCFEHQGYVCLLLDSNEVSRPEVICEYFLTMTAEGQPVIAWDEKGFFIAVPLSDRKKARAIRDLWSAFQDGDIYLGGPFSKKMTGHGGIGIFIASKLPDAEIRKANERLRRKADRARLLEKAVQREGFEKIQKKLQKAGKHWFVLTPKRIDDDGNVRYWLNPRSMNCYFGWVSIQDLKDWLEGRGKIPKVNVESQQIN